MRSFSSSSLALLLLPALSTFVLASPTSQQAVFEVDPEVRSHFSSKRSSISLLARLAAVNQCSSSPSIHRSSFFTTYSSSQTHSITYIQPSPLESTFDAVALLSSATSSSDLVPLRSPLLPNVPEDVLVMRFVRNKFEKEAHRTFSLLERSLMQTREGSKGEQTIDMVGAGLAGPLALLHALHLHHSLPPILELPKIAITTFSAPRYANEAFSDYVQSLLSPNLTLDVVSSGSDALPLLPARGAKKTGFRDLHAGSKWEMVEDGAVRHWESGLLASVRREVERKEREKSGDATDEVAKGWEAQLGGLCSWP